MPAPSVLELRIVGPGLDLVRRLEAGADDLVIGRDPDCDVCLPDPLRNISRRHLAVRNQDGELHFRVLSTVNGIHMPFGEAPAGAQGVLPAGQQLALSSYVVTAQPLAASAEVDPWAVFDQQDASGTIARAFTGLFPPGQVPPRATQAEDDPFGDWGFQTTFGPNGWGGGPLEASKLQPATDLQPFLRGLGLEHDRAARTEGELEALGRLVRTAVQGLLALQQAHSDFMRALQPGDLTAQAPRAPNALMSDAAVAQKLQYLFAASSAASRQMHPEKALRQLVRELEVHFQTLAPALQATVAGTLREFEPEALKSRLVAGQGKLFESARAWEAFARDYRKQADDWPEWVQRLLANYFTDAYMERNAGTAAPEGRQDG